VERLLNGSSKKRKSSQSSLTTRRRPSAAEPKAVAAQCRGGKQQTPVVWLGRCCLTQSLMAAVQWPKGAGGGATQRCLWRLGGSGNSIHHFDGGLLAIKACSSSSFSSPHLICDFASSWYLEGTMVCSVLNLKKVNYVVPVGFGFEIPRSVYVLNSSDLHYYHALQPRLFHSISKSDSRRRTIVAVVRHLNWHTGLNQTIAMVAGIPLMAGVIPRGDWGELDGITQYLGGLHPLGD
jgi:hypothetical protein